MLRSNLLQPPSHTLPHPHPLPLSPLNTLSFRLKPDCRHQMDHPHLLANATSLRQHDFCQPTSHTVTYIARNTSLETTCHRIHVLLYIGEFDLFRTFFIPVLSHVEYLCVTTLGPWPRENPSLNRRPLVSPLSVAEASSFTLVSFKWLVQSPIASPPHTHLPAGRAINNRQSRKLRVLYVA